MAPKLDEEAIAKLDEVLQSAPEGQKILSQGIGTISDPAGAAADKAVRETLIGHDCLLHFIRARNSSLDFGLGAKKSSFEPDDKNRKRSYGNQLVVYLLHRFD